MTEPRKVSNDPIDDADLEALTTEEPADKGGGGPPPTCHSGWTLVCETPPPGVTCTTGFTYVCDNGTCTYGWTFRCDTWPSAGGFEA